MSVPLAVSDIDPAARALAEVRAREEGVTLIEWIRRAVYQQSASPSRPPVFYGGGVGLPVDRDYRDHLHYGWAPRSLFDSSFTTHVYHRSDASPYDMDIAIKPTAREHDLSTIWILAAFPSRIDHAAILLSAAFAEADVQDFRPRIGRTPRSTRPSGWYDTLVTASLQRSREVCNALTHRWTPTGRAERLRNDAFLTLCELSPARQELLQLWETDWTRASSELAKHLELATQQFELSANLFSDLDTASAQRSDEDRFGELRSNLLERAGGGVSLTEGAAMLGVTRQALHKRIRSGTALGMMDGDEIVLPRLQWTVQSDTTVFVPGVSAVLKLFKSSGGWSALQFLLEPDPNLDQAPIDSLHAGRGPDVITAARAYLGLDQG